MSTKPGDWWDKSLNSWQGCTPISEACENCWALANLKHWHGQPPGQIRYFPERLKKLEHWRKSRHIFVCSLSDIFHEFISTGRLLDLAHTIERYPRHTFYLLTKRPQFAFPRHMLTYPNIRLGITVENQVRFNHRWRDLRRIDASFKFLHAEPLLGPIDISPAIGHVQWVVVGGENGQRARPMHPEWVRRIRDQCIEAHIPFWFKSWGQWKQEESIERNNPSCWMKNNSRYRWLNFAGGHGFHGNNVIAVRRVKDSDRLLEGREWNERP